MGSFWHLCLLNILFTLLISAYLHNSNVVLCDLNMIIYVKLLIVVARFAFILVSTIYWYATKHFKTLKQPRIIISQVFVLLGLAGWLCTLHVVIHLAALSLEARLPSLGLNGQIRFYSNVWRLNFLWCRHSVRLVRASSHHWFQAGYT
jgi:hypothetical protein